MMSNILVVGLGSMGKRRIRLLKLINHLGVIIGVDKNLERCNFVKSHMGIECYKSLEEAEKVVQIDCAFICTPPLTHADMIYLCLSHGYHVFSEINLVSNKYDENIGLAREKNKTLFLSSTPLYEAEMQYMKQKIASNDDTCVYQYHVGQYLPDWHPWDDLQNFFVSQKLTNGCRELLAIELPWIQSVFGKINKVNVIKKKLTDLNIDFPDTYLIQIEHEKGNIGNLLIDVVSRQAVRNLEIINEKVYIKWEGTPDSLYQKDILPSGEGEMKLVLTGEYVHEQGYRKFVNEYAYMKEIEDFFNAIQGKEPLYSFEKDKEVLLLIDKIES